MYLNRIFRLSVLVALATTIFFSPGVGAPAAGLPIQNSFAGAPLPIDSNLDSPDPFNLRSTDLISGDEDPPGPEEPYDPFDIDPYPDYVELKNEDRQLEIQELIDSSNEQSSEIEATSDYTVTLGAWRNLRPTESYLWDVSLLPPDMPVDCSENSRGWIVGDAGTILGYCNGVWDHHISVQSRFTRLWGVQAISPTLSVAVGEEGAIQIYLWDHVAQDWEWTKSPISVGNQTLYRVSMVRESNGNYTGWAVGSADPATGHGTLIKGNIWTTEVAGHITHDYEWFNMSEIYPAMPIVDYYYGVQMLSPTNGWATGGKLGGGGFFLHWDGTQWSLFQEAPANPVHGLFMRSANDGYASGLGGELYHFNGTSWTQIPSPTTYELVDLGFDENGIGWAIGLNGTLLRYENGQWAPFTDLRTDPIEFRALDFTSGHGWMVGLNKAKLIGGHILEYEDGLWLAVTPPTDNALNDISVISDNDAWAVGAADAQGGTIIHWDGRHWQRWYQKDLPIPAVDLYAIDMVDPDYGWASGNPPQTGEKAVLLFWDGHRWAPTRYDSPINVRVTDISMLDRDFGWATANTGNAVAKFDGVFDYWSANHTCQGIFYDLRSVSVVPDSSTIFGWDAWSVGTSLNPATGEYFMRYMDGCTGYAWDTYEHPWSCPQAQPPDPEDGWKETKLQGIKMDPGKWGYAAGDYKSRASVYYYDEATGNWDTIWCHSPDIHVTPSRIYSVDIVENTGVAWFGGYYSSQKYNRKVAFIQYIDSTGIQWAGSPFPLNGVNIYDRPIRSIDMSSNTMGWAVGDPEDAGKRSVIYQYPYPNFTLNITPETRALRPGEATSYSISANSIGGFSADVTLSAISFPPGISGIITPATISAGVPATFQVQTSPSTPLGTYEILVLGYAVFTSGDWDIPVWRINSLWLTVTDNPVYGISPEKGPAGTVVTIAGSNFGLDPGVGNRSTPANHVSWAGVQLPDAYVTSWSDSQIKFTPPDNPDLFLPEKFPLLGVVTVTARGTISNADFFFQMENHISSLVSAQAASRYLVTLTGTSFGNDPTPLFRSTSYEHIALGGLLIPATDVVSWNNTQIQFYVDASTPSGPVVVTSNGYESNQIMYVSKSGSTKVYLPMQRR